MKYIAKKVSDNGKRCYYFHHYYYHLITNGDIRKYLLYLFLMSKINCKSSKIT